MNSPVYFELQADDVDRCMHFYQSVFGWKFVDQPTLNMPYWRIETSGIQGGLLPRPVTTHSGGINAAVISMEVVSYDETARTILATGGIEVLSKFAIPGRCWQGYFQDTEGNTFGIFEVDESARV